MKAWMGRDEFLEHLRRWRAGDSGARDRIVASFLPIVGAHVSRLGFARKNFEDAVQEGVIGLCVAIDRFDESRGTAFATYATLWVRAHVMAYVKNGHTVRGSTTRDGRKTFFGIGRADRELTLKLGRDPTDAELAEHMGVHVEEVTRVRNRLYTDFSLDQVKTTSEAGHAKTYLDDLVDESPTPEDLVISAREHADGIARLDAFKRELSLRDRVLYERRIVAEDPESLRAVGARLGVSGERVRQLEQRLLARLRKHLLGKP